MSGAFCSLSPMSAAVYAALNVGALTALAPGGVWDEIPQGTVFPCVLIELQEVQQLGGFGTAPGHQAVVELELRIHVFSQYAGMKQAQTVMAKVMELLAPGSLNPTGYKSHGPFHQDTVPLPDEVVAGVRVNELVARYRLYAEEL